jgi:hypothetical protein
MSLIETVMKLDRKVRKLYDELGLDYDDTKPVTVPDSTGGRTIARESNMTTIPPRKSPVMGCKRWSKEDREAMLSLHHKGVGNNEIAGLLHRTQSSVNTQLWKLKKDGKLAKAEELDNK